MEILGLINIPSWLLTVFLLFLTLYLYTAWKHSLWRRLGVPGPTPFPFLGVLKDAIQKGILKNDVELVKKYGRFFGTYNGTIPQLYVSDPDLIKELFIKESQTFTNRVLILKTDELLDNMITGAVDDHWKFLRSTMTPTFTTGKLKAMVSMVQRCCNDLVGNIISKNVDGQDVDMKEVCSGYTMDVIATTAFGLQVNSQKEPNNAFVVNARKVVSTNLFRVYFILVLVFPFLKDIMGSLFTAPVMGEGCREFFQAIVSQLIEERRKTSNNNYRDFIQLMLNAHKDADTEASTEENGLSDMSKYKNRGMTESEILSNSMIFFGAGFDTTANTLAFAVYRLALHPDIQDKLHEEIDTELGKGSPSYDILNNLPYLDKFLNEVLRMYAAATRINRHAKKDITVQGHFIPKGTDVTVPIAALHRDPEYWPDPEKFDPERFSEENKAKRPMYSFLPFGLGPRNCIGMRLALLEAKFAIISMVQNFRFSPCEKTEIPIVLDPSFLVRPKNGVYLKIEKR